MNTLITALATPYKDGKVDTLSYEKLVLYQLNSGVDALLAVGTTAEAQLLTKNEKQLLITQTKQLAKRTPVWVGIAGRSTTDVMCEAVFAEELGADGLLVAPPAFVKCTPKGYVQYINEILKVVSIPVMLYNAPSRCNYTLNKEAVSELSKRVRYMKDAGKNLSYTAALSSKMKVLCGNDTLLCDMLNCGASGVVSVVSNVAPLLTRRILDGQYTAEDYELFKRLCKLSMLEVSPVAIKYLLYKKGIFEGYNMRLPLTRANEQTRKKINKFWLGYSKKDSPLR
ncbi:MAG: 4-hydroxy-tetrahydrodipicolinate synthase [Clostridiales bacterium]|nr:4-hydroxy-tetrahydrodipicolinate synthase [Clostridiales bacterium]